MTIARTLLLTALCTIVVSCADDGDEGTEQRLAPAAPLPPAAPAGPTVLGPPAELSQGELNNLLQLEKDRISDRKAASGPAFDSLKAEWHAFQEGQSTLAPSPLMRCDARKFEGEAKIIGPAGGEVKAGPHKLKIPAGALPWNSVISIEAPPALEIAIELSPKAVGFAVPLTLEVDYGQCAVPDSMPAFRGVFVSADGTVLEFRPAVDERQPQPGPGPGPGPGPKKLKIELDHFSKYAVAY